jgi:RHH-type rel operon transcriptional repressor/antitoxin RelB
VKTAEGALVLSSVGSRTGRTKHSYIREAILQHLEDLDDLYFAEVSLKRIRAGKNRTIPLETILTSHGIEN